MADDQLIWNGIFAVIGLVAGVGLGMFLIESASISGQAEAPPAMHAIQRIY